jgi:hypothetical protein
MAPTENCDVHNSSQDTEKPVITIKDVTKDTIEIKVNDKFSIPTATATDNIDGDISKNITTQIKKDGEVVEKIDTSKAGTYTITYTVEDAAKNTATKTITLKITDSDDKTTNTVTTNTVTNTVTSNTVSNTVSNTLTQNSVTNTEQ